MHRNKVLTLMVVAALFLAVAIAPAAAQETVER